MSVVERVMAGSFDADELEDLLEDLLAGRIAAADGARVLIALHEQPISPELLVAGASVLRRHSVPVHTPPNRAIIDTSGTGGDGQGTVNLSTCAALLVAACDGTVAKQAFSSHTGAGGSIGLLAALGVRTNLSAQQVTAALEHTGFAVLPTARFLPARDRLAALLPPGGARALFRLWTPLANPAFPDCQLVGVHDARFTERMARALALLGVDRALVVHCGGLAELGLHADTVGHTWIDGRVKSFHCAGTGVPLAALAGGSTAENAARVQRMFAKERSPLADAVALNAGAALWIGGHLPTFAEARRWAQQRLSQGVHLADFHG